MFIPDKSKNANEMILELSNIPPGHSKCILKFYSNIENLKSTNLRSFIFGKDKNYEIYAIDFHEYKSDTLFFRKTNSKFLSKLNINKNQFSIEKRVFILGSDRFGRDFLS